MLVSNNVYKNRYVYDGTQFNFPISFPFLDEKHIQVRYAKQGQEDTDSHIMKSTHYMITGAGNPAGGVLTRLSNWEPGIVIVIIRDIPITQLHQYTQYDNFPAESHEDALAKLTMICQELDEICSRAITVPVTSKKTPQEWWKAIYDEIMHVRDQILASLTLAGNVTGATMVVADGTTTPRSISDRFADVVNVKDFGAKGDGVTDDTDSIQYALDLASEKGKRIFFPAGIYLCFDTISIPSNTRLFGDKGAVLRRNFNVGRAGQSALVVYKLVSPDVVIHDISIDGIIFDGNGSEFDSVSFDIMYMAEEPIYRVDISDCTFRDCIDFHALDINRACDVTISGCRFEGWKHLYSEGWFADKREAIQFDGYSVEDEANRNRNITIKNCYFGPSLTEGFSSYPAGIGNHGWFDSSVGCHDITIQDCFFDECSYAAITCMALKNVIISGNFFNRCKDGVHIIARNNSTNFIKAICENITITTNVFIGKDENTGNAVYSWTSSGTDMPVEHLAGSLNTGLIFSNNTVTGYNRYCSFLSQQKATITGNMFSSGGGMSLNGGSGIKCFGNTFVKSGVVYFDTGQASYSFSGLQDFNTGKEFSQNTIIDPKTRACHFVNINYGVSINENTIIDNNETVIALPYIMANGGQKGLVIRGNTIQAKIDRTSTYISILKDEASISNNVCIIENVQKFPYGNNNTVQFADTYLGSKYHHDSDGYERTGLIFKKGAKEYTQIISSINEANSNVAINIGGGSVAFEDVNRINMKIKSGEEVSLTQGYFLPATDNTVSLGGASNRWSNVYAESSSITTSDERDKNSIENMSDIEYRAWRKVNFKQFRFSSSIERKGEGARIHSGVIAQQIKSAFESEGLDPFKYGLLCYDEWPDEYESVVIVDEPEHQDTEGNWIPAVTHTEQKLIRRAGGRYSVRYEEVLAREAAYQRWIGERNESRIAALEEKLNNAIAQNIPQSIRY